MTSTEVLEPVVYLEKLPHYSATAHVTTYTNPERKTNVNPNLTPTLTLIAYQASAIPILNHASVTLLHVSYLFRMGADAKVFPSGVCTYQHFKACYYLKHHW